MASSIDTPFSLVQTFYRAVAIMPGGKDSRALTERACVVSDASDSGIGAAEKEVGGGRPGTWGGSAVSNQQHCHYFEGVLRV